MNCPQQPRLHSRHPDLIHHPSPLNPHQSPEYRARPDPSVDEPSVVPDLETTLLNCLDDMEILRPFDLTENNVADLQCLAMDRFNRTELTRLYFRRHRISTGTKRDGFSKSPPNLNHPSRCLCNNILRLRMLLGFSADGFEKYLLDVGVGAAVAHRTAYVELKG